VFLYWRGFGITKELRSGSSKNKARFGQAF
jgi:hypothetical protein